MSTRISELMLERYLVGAATADEKARIEASPEALERVEAMRRENDELLALHSPRVVAAKVSARAADAPRVKPFLWLAPLVALACAVLFVVVPRGPDDEVIILKGAKPHIALYRQVGNTNEKLTSGASARAGDTVQVSYVAAEATYGAIVSVDGRGNVTVHTPTNGDGKLSQRNEVLLPRAYTLDDAPRFERFVFVAATRPVDIAKLQKMLRDEPELDAEKLRRALGGVVDVFTLRKEP
ncbi:MAG: ActD-like protein [Myxococcota bacterium]